MPGLPSPARHGRPRLAYAPTAPSEGSARRARLVALLAVAAIVSLMGPGTAQGAAHPASSHSFVATELSDTAAGRQTRWLLEASTRAPVSEIELRAHFTEAFLAIPGASPADINRVLATFVPAGGMRLMGLTFQRDDALVAVVAAPGGPELVLTVVVEPSGLIDYSTLAPSAGDARVTLPAPSGRAPVGTDVVGIVDSRRSGRRLVATRWYPAANAARRRPRAAYAGPLLTGALGLPPVRVHARADARPRTGRHPVVLFSPGYGTPRIIYQALAEDLASHGYLVVAVDHTGEAPMELPRGAFQKPLPPPKRRIIATAAATRLADMRLVLRRLRTLPGLRADRRRIAAVGHSLGGSTAAALMRVERSVDAGVDMDGSIFGSARRRGVRRPFLVMTGSRGLDGSLGSFLRRSRGPRLAISFAGLEHMSFSDLPVVAPGALREAKAPSSRDIAVQRAYLRAFLDRFLRGRRSRLLEKPSSRWPQADFRYRRDCCAPER